MCRRNALVSWIRLTCWLGVLLVVLSIAGVMVAADDLFVAENGSGSVCAQGSPCALETALAQAWGGDVVHVAQGAYTGVGGSSVISLTRSIHLWGGWNELANGPIEHDPAMLPTVLDGLGRRRVIHISPNITPTIEGFEIVNGDATGLTDGCVGSGGKPGGCGGGIFAANANPRIVNNVIRDNVAMSRVEGTDFLTGYGGGVYLYNCDRAVVEYNHLVNNWAATVQSGLGGGIGLRGCDEGTEIVGNWVISNTATTGSSVGWGGGIALTSSDALVIGNVIEENLGSAQGTSQGSGYYHWYGSSMIEGNAIRFNRAGEGVYLGNFGGAFATNKVIGNQNRGVQVIYGDEQAALLLNNVIAGSSIGVSISGTAKNPAKALMLHNTIAGDGQGMGIAAGGTGVVTATNNILVGNQTAVSLEGTSLTLTLGHTLFWDNASDGLQGTAPVMGNPQFVSPPNEAFNLGFGSAAVDVGADVGVWEDMAGRSRPQGAAPDVGAYEFAASSGFLPLLLKNGA